MPIIAPSDKVLVTGANGYVGVWVVKLLLDRGYKVRGAVRSKEKGEALAKIIKDKSPGHAADFEYAVVEDLTADHAYDDAVKGVSGAVHVASPLTSWATHPDQVVKPAVEGTLGLLRSALAHGQDMKRIVITSSVRAVIRADAGRTYTEEDWADDAVAEVKEKGSAANGMSMYGASKVLAERAAWGFHAEHKDEVGWDLVTIDLGWVYGPTVEDPATPKELPSTAGLFYNMISGNPMFDSYNGAGMNYIDSRDGAEAHVKALEVEAAGGERLLVTSHWCHWQDWRNKAGELGYFPKLDKGDPQRCASLQSRPCSSEKARRVLGSEFRKLPETLKDTLDYYRKRGWLAEYEA
uniref:Ketoreductase CTB6 ) n=1 Tax=Ganoderma boninense TaxID=34458 RepID=A0A5K1JVY2_9APHY|nr:Ketoreductase CTB6 (EC (Cercosporin toxin biosynthesis cluster protein 6) [Ganoderma boninense]